MLKKYFLLFLSLTTLVVASQDYKAVDSVVKTYPSSFSSADKLAKRISADFTSELHRARAVYFWIANNVAYDPQESGKFSYEYGTREEYLRKEKNYNGKLSTRAVSKGKAVCEGYSTLFAETCKLLNIKAKVVSGSSKTEITDIGKRFSTDHAWNVVEIDKKLHLVDATWGAGSYEGKFIKEVDSFYFLTPPELFIKNHYPEYYEYALLKDKTSKEHFLNAPVIYDHELELLFPLNGTINRAKGMVKIAYACEPGRYSVICELDGKEILREDVSCTDNKLEFEVDVSQVKRARELLIFIDYKANAAFRVR